MSADPSENDGVSIVVPCHNADATIDAQLAALAGQDFAHPFEVLVVDNASTDDTLSRCQAWVGQLPSLRVVPASTRQGPGYARNVGIDAAAHEMVLACDADDIADRAWVRKMVEALAHADVVGGGLAEWHGGPLPEPAVPKPFGRAGFGFLPTFSGCNFGIRKSTWRAIGGFDEALLTCEDIDLGWRAQLDGYRFASRVDAFVYHYTPLGPRDVFRRSLRYGLFQPRLFARYRAHAMMRQRSHRALARWLVVLVTSYRLVIGTAELRRRWYAEAGRRVGRAAGSIRFRSLYL